jgi:hypothetical protein
VSPVSQFTLHLQGLCLFTWYVNLWNIPCIGIYQVIPSITCPSGQLALPRDPEGWGALLLSPSVLIRQESLSSGWLLRGSHQATLNAWGSFSTYLITFSQDKVNQLFPISHFPLLTWPLGEQCLNSWSPVLHLLLEWAELLRCESTAESLEDLSKHELLCPPPLPEMLMPQGVLRVSQGDPFLPLPHLLFILSHSKIQDVGWINSAHTYWALKSCLFVYSFIHSSV